MVPLGDGSAGPRRGRRRKDEGANHHVNDGTRPVDRVDWKATSPLTTVDPAAILREMRTEGPVSYLLAHGYRDDDSFGVIGAFWLSIDDERGGFLVHPAALWTGSELARNYRNALERDWTHAGIFDYWQREGFSGIELVLDRDPRISASLRVLWKLLAGA
jgi:hypothetical protein